MQKFHLPALVAIMATSLTALAAIQPAGAQSPPSGDQLFRQRCAACHVATANQRAGVGPNLFGVVGRKAAATPFNYSAALKVSGLTWTRANLDRFLAAPVQMVPGTRMAVAVTDGGQRAALINFLAARK